MKPDGMNADAVRTPPAMLINLNGIGPEIAAVLWSEGLYRSFANRKQVAAYAGLAPTPWQSDRLELLLGQIEAVEIERVRE
jgi:transposase